MNSLPSGWTVKPLGDVATLQRGFDLPVQQRVSGNVPVFAANGTVGTHNVAKVKGPGVVTGRSGTLGEVHYVESDFWALNTALWVKDFHGNDPRWIARLLKWMRLETHTRGTGVPTLNRNLVHVVPVLLPPIEEQRRIADILDRADAIRRKRQEAIRMTEELLRSAFLEMFGDPATNPKGWKIVPMKDAVSQTQYGTAEKANSEKIGVPVLRMNNITYKGEINIDDIKWCPVVSKDEEKLTVRRGDLLFNRTNSPELVGKTAVWRSDEKYAYAGYLVRVRFQESQTLPDYVSAYLNSSFGKKYLFEKAKPSNNMSNFSASEFLRIPLLLPPLELQKHFALLADTVRSSMNQLEGVVRDADDLFNSLLQRAFRGEL